MALRVDEIGFGGYTLVQDTDSFCYGVDAVLLADFAQVQPDDTVLDLGCGNGIVPLILMAKGAPRRICGLELQPDAAQLATENVRRNGLAETIDIQCGDVKDAGAFYPAGSFSLVTCNPPYFPKGKGIPNAPGGKLAARQETTADLEAFISAAAHVLEVGGRFVLVHRPWRLCDILTLCRKYGLEPKRMRMVVPRAGESPNIVLLSCVKGGGVELTVLPELPVRLGDGFTPEINEIYGRI